jgi:hypothetical protein
MQSDLLELTRELLINRQRNCTYRKIQRDTGLSEYWLALFANSREHDPGVRKVETLYRYLTGQALVIR